MSVVELPEGGRHRPAHARRSVAPRSTRALRLTLGVLSLVSLVAGSLAFTLGADELRAVGLLVFCIVGVGSAPWQLVAELRGYERLTLTFVTGTAVTILVPTLLPKFASPPSSLAFVAIAALVVPLHLLGLSQLRDEVRADAHPAWPSSWLPLTRTSREARGVIRRGLPALAIAVSGAALCLVAAVGHRHLEPGAFGFLPHIGPIWYLGLALVLVALLMDVSVEYGRAVPAFLLVLVLTLTPALVYDGPRSQVAAKHIEFIQRIQESGSLESTLPVYRAYAGFFDGMAWLCDVTGISDLVQLAALWPVLLGLFRVAVLRYLAGRFLTSSRQCWTAVTLAVLADAINGDYFSPQSLGFVLGMATIAVAMTRTPEVPRLPVVLLGGCALAVSHQLSPYIVGGVLVVLASTRALGPWWIPALVLVPSVLWSAVHWDAVSGYLSVDALGRLSNFEPPETVNAPTLERLPVVQQTVWATVLGIGVLGALALISLIRQRRDRRQWGLALCPGVGLVIVAVQPYGQEGVFRAALFGIPWLAIMAATAVDGRPALLRLTSVATTACLTVTFLVASFGLDGLNVMRPSDYTAVQRFWEEGGRNPPVPYYLLLLNPGDQPTSPEFIGDRHTIWSRPEIEQPVQEMRSQDPELEVASLTSALVRYTGDDSPSAELYALWSPVGANYGQAYGVRSLQQSVALRDAFASSPYWSVDFREDGTYLFRFQRVAFGSATSR